MKKIVCLPLLLWVSCGYCDKVSDALQMKLNAIHTMSASFAQVVHAKKREISRSSGSMALARPGHFRWQTKDPMSQLVVADGTRLWIYDVDLEQVTVKKQEKGVGGTAGLFLSGYNDTVTRDFTVTVKQDGQKSAYDLHAKSKKANFTDVQLTFDGDRLVGIALRDQLGQRTLVTLTQIKQNPRLPSSLFEFKAPKGVDVIRQ